MSSEIMRFFEYDHLPIQLQNVSIPFATLARDLQANILEGPEKEAGMRKLLEAKDCFVRAKL